MTLLYLAGDQLNALETLLSGAVTSTSEDSDYPLSHLYAEPGIYQPSRPFRFNAIAADLHVTWDLQRVTNGDFETGTLDGWTDASTGTGSTDKEASIVNGGTGALKCSGGAGPGVGQRYQDVTVRTGSYFKIAAQLRGDGSASARCRVQCLQTGRYWDGAAWGAADDLDAESGAAYRAMAETFQIETWDAVGGVPLVTLRIWFLCNENGDGYVDDVELYEGLNWLSIHGHNLTPVISPQLRSSTDAFSASDDLEATLTIYRPAFYAKLDAITYRRYWRLLLSGTPLAIPYLGALVPGIATEMAQPQSWGYLEHEEYLQIRHVGATGQQWATRRTEDAPQGLRLSFEPDALADYLELRDELSRRTYGGEKACVVAPYHQPDAGEAREVVHGRLPATWDASRAGVLSRRLELSILADPGPLVGL